VNAEETARLVSIVRSLYPAQRFDDEPRNVVNAWGSVLLDVTWDEAHAAVVRIARRGATWCSPGDVRSEIARARNVLTPDADQLLAGVREVASRDGVGRKLLHPVARAVYDSIGGAQSVKRLDARGLLQLRRELERKSETHDDRVLVDEWPPPQPPALPVAAKIELEAAAAPREIEQRDTHPETAEKLRQMRDDFGAMP
jgi:hypothetical protein